MRSWQKINAKPQKIGVLLFDHYSNHCLANAVEPLRAANTLLGRTVYNWNYLSVDGAPVTSSSGLSVTAEFALQSADPGDALMVISSYGFRAHATVANLRMLRAAAGRYATMVGMDTGSWLLAAAGLLNHRRATIHWDEIESFRERFDQVEVSRERVVFDGDRWSCGGAMTAFELVLRMIGRSHGEALRLEVASLFMHMEGGGLAGVSGAMPLPKSGVVAAALTQMRANLEEPLTIPELAQKLGQSVRRLETLFQADVGAGPQKVYRRVRLLAARRYVEQTGMSIAEIALRCGYVDPSALTRAFRQEFGLPPRILRQSAQAEFS